LTPQVFGLLGMLQDLEYKIRASPLTRVTWPTQNILDGT
jgi:hypothetical protein